MVTEAHVYITSLFFCVLFRACLVIHAEKGLTDCGRPNLRLFNQLFWVCEIFFLAFSLVTMPISQILKGDFPRNTRKGRVCLLLNVDDPQFEKDDFQSLLMGISYPMLYLIYSEYLNNRVNRVIKKLCPGKKMSCIGL